jgi:hypothetical protein
MLPLLVALQQEFGRQVSRFILKVVGNEKGGGLVGWLLFEDASGPWRSMSVYFLLLPSSFPQRISVSCL